MNEPEIEIVLNQNGVWLLNGEEITHARTCRAFSQNIFQTEGGFEIRIGPEKKAIQVEDTLYFVTGISGDQNEGFTLNLNDGREVNLDPHTLLYKPGRLTCRVLHPNNGMIVEAKFLTSAYYQLLAHLEKNEDGFFIKIKNEKIILDES